MSQVREVLPVVEESLKFKGIQHVNVEKTVELIGKALQEGGQVSILTRQSEISRAGMIMKRVEEDFKARIVSMKTENRTEKKVEEEKEREFNVLYFRATFEKTA
jgi:transketolase